MLKKDAIRLLHASRDTLFLAACGLGIPRTTSPNPASARCAEIGLIGAAVEMAMSACVLQCHGPDFLREKNGYFKSAQRILDDFKTMLESPSPASSFLFAGVTDPKSHKDSLHLYLDKFSFLITVRAAGLHGGLGVTRDTALLKAQEVGEFLQLIGKSNRIGAYIEQIPIVVESQPAAVVLLDELVNRINDSDSSQEKAALLGSLFLVLPNTPKELPGWVASFKQISLAPKAKDITLLLDTLSVAQPGSLKRLSQSGNAIPVKVDQNNPNALSIAPHMLRRSIEKPFEQWHGDSSMANGRLSQSILHLPPIDFVLYLFAAGLELDGIQSNTEKIPHIETWPFVAASLHAPGTLRPHWFLVRKTDDHPQLISYLAKAAKLSTRIQANLADLKDGIAAMKSGNHLATSTNTSRLLTKLLLESYNADKQISKMRTDAKLITSEALRIALDSVEQEEITTGMLLQRLVDGEFKDVNKSSWVAKLCTSAREPVDIAGLLAVLQSTEFKPIHSNARKALYLIDLVQFGPPCSIDWGQLL